MPNNLISMSKIRQALRLYEAGNGTKTISHLMDVSRNTVKKYIAVFNKSGKTIDEVLAMSDGEFFQLFGEDSDCFSRRSERFQDTIENILPNYSKLLRKKGMTRTKVWEKYREDHPDGYSRSRFFEVLQIYNLQQAPVAHLEHKAGDRMYVDFAGDKLHIIDQETGEKLPVEVFVAILPCSQITFVEAVMSQKKEDFIKACEKAFYFFGGVPAVIVPDNLKAAVTHPNKYESVLNADFAAFADHYGCAVLPARVRRPKDKALVEGAVKLIYRSIYPHLEGRDFFNLEALNEAIRVALEMHNNALLTGRNYSRREQFEEVERCCLRPLNPIKFELKLRHICTVQRNGYVMLEKHYYSVPCDLIGKKVNILYNTTKVDIYHKFECVASHERSYKVYGFTTISEHLPKSQKSYLEWDPEKLLNEGEAIHPDVKAFMMKVLESKRYPEQAYKSLKGILALAVKVGEERLAKACRLATILGVYSYQAVENILANKQENAPIVEDAEEEDGTIPEHENLRGKEYYK